MPAHIPPLVVAALLVLETFVSGPLVAQATPVGVDQVAVESSFATEPILQADLLWGKKIPGRRQGAGTR